LTLKNYCKAGVDIMAIIKADAYGHGSTMFAQQLEALGVNYFGVASVDEGIELRKAGCSIPILVLGSVPTWAFVSAVQNDIELSVFTKDHINAAIQAFEHCNKPVKVHVKIDTGMNRIGISYKDAVPFIQEVLSRQEIQLCGIFSHLACAEDIVITKKQADRFQNVINLFPNIRAHLLNTAGLMSYPEYQFDMVRAGIGIYGLIPDLSKEDYRANLKPVMSLKGRIAHLKTVQADEGISYSYTYKTNKNTIVATVPMGYADGISRGLSNKIFGLINGQKIPQIGNITMDQMMFDVTGLDVNVGDVITLVGEDENQVITIDEWAKILDTIHYELTCRLKVRLPRVYTR